MLKLALAAAAALFVLPAFGQQLQPSCDLAKTEAVLRAGGLEVLGLEAVRFSPVSAIVVRQGGAVGLVFVLNGCPEHAADGPVAVHLVGPYRPESST